MHTPAVELTKQQWKSLENLQETPPLLVNPHTNEKFVLLPLNQYQSLKELEYDDSPWTSEERHALAWNAGKHAGWEEMNEYDEFTSVESR